MNFSHYRWLIVFHWSLSDRKFSQVSRTLLSILADLNNVVVWMVLILPSISNSCRPLSKSLGTVPSALITIGIIIALMFYTLRISLARSKFLSFFLVFSFCFHSFAFFSFLRGIFCCQLSLVIERCWVKLSIPVSIWQSAILFRIFRRYWKNRLC